MAELLRDEQGRLVGGPTLAEVQARLIEIHTEPRRSHELWAQALSIGHPVLQQTLHQQQQVPASANHIESIVPTDSPDEDFRAA